MKAFFATGCVAVALAIAPAAPAHTTIRIAGNQIVEGGYVAAYGAADNVQVNDGPGTDGTIAWSNLDDVAHHLIGQCISGDCMTAQWDPVKLKWGPKKLNLVVPARNGASPGSAGISAYPRGTYEYGDANISYMQARFRVTSGSH